MQCVTQENLIPKIYYLPCTRFEECVFEDNSSLEKAVVITAECEKKKFVIFVDKAVWYNAVFPAIKKEERLSFEEYIKFLNASHI